MTKWEYRRIIVPSGGGDPFMQFLHTTKEACIHETIEAVETTVAQLGRDGWEMVSCTQVWAVGTTALPVYISYYFKRPIATDN